MRTTLYLSAALAAMTFNLEASATSLAHIEQNSALAETYVDTDLNLEAEAEKVGVPANMPELLDMMQNGSSAPRNKILRNGILIALRGAGQG